MKGELLVYQTFIPGISAPSLAKPDPSAHREGLMPIPDLCILECVITGYYKLMNVIITRESMYSPSACV